MIAFCESIQRKSPVGAYIRPIPGYTAGYGNEVIFADGTFTEGSTLELSADGPLRKPFIAYAQVTSYLPMNILFHLCNSITKGCTHWTHWALVLEDVLKQEAFAR